ncbi:MAG: FGGY family carbohydrate kinase [Clostridia bacterium]|nr:FGGY family carbohydrate kinase [Clostridia bacterium]
MLFMGLDVGTQGARCVVCDENGNIVAAYSVAFSQINCAKDPGLFEQRPDDWQTASETAIAKCVERVKEAGLSPADILSISIDGTSGTIIPLDGDFKPLTNAIMYNDPRAKSQAARVHQAMQRHEQKLGLRFGSSFSLPRILWIKENLPDVYDKTRVFAHQADCIAGIMSGEYCVSDYSNALKTGYDMINSTWPAEIERELGIDTGKLPRVIRPGESFANVSKQAATRLGLSEHTLLTGGSTDGYASALATGAVKNGDWASIIGTTFVLKGVTNRLVIDPNGSSYSHRLPSGEWLMGGASNTGGKCLNSFYPDGDFAGRDKRAMGLGPTGVRCYPLTAKGERFPFVNAEAEAFYIGDISGDRLYRAIMEGVGFAERLAFERMIKMGLSVSDVVFTTGGASKSDLWLEIRASILNRQLAAPSAVDAAMGSALLAASEHFGSLAGAAKSLIRIKKRVDPRREWVDQYEKTYRAFEEDVRKLYGVEI